MNVKHVILVGENGEISVIEGDAFLLASISNMRRTEEGKYTAQRLLTITGSEEENLSMLDRVMQHFRDAGYEV
ncbi:hypothetical protein SAMN04488600_101602 [Paenibacillus polymyxa]|nr:hypothetical protein SAMN04488600_101602 [Paenibacillus polymyxa]